MERISIDAHVLVVYLEILTAIILRCLRPSNADGVILPRSFLVQFVQRRRPPRFDLRELDPLLLPLQQLVEAIHIGYGMAQIDRDYAIVLLMDVVLSRLPASGRPIAGEDLNSISLPSNLSDVGATTSKFAATDTSTVIASGA